jgi:guanosine-3',5'-bis(diphosphate) 3'-pyrophosphohydrolase
MSREAALVKLADKICNLRDAAANPPPDWSVERRTEYFEWAKAVIDGLPQVSVELLGLFNAAYAARPHCGDRK